MDLDKIWAVHASEHLWTDCIIRPYTATNLRGIRSGAISETIHFSLGSLVRPHHDISNWDDNPIAVITPLRNLLDKLLSIYAYDTFILGPLSLLDAPGTILILSDQFEVDRNLLERYREAGIKIVFFNNNLTTLRKTVEDNIKVNIDLLPYELMNGTPAYMDDVNINTPEWFQPLFDAYPNISFGSDICSVFGDGFYYGFVRQLTQIISKGNIMDKTLAAPYLKECMDKIGDRLTIESQEKIYSLIDENLPILEALKEYKGYLTPLFSFLINLDYQQVLDFMSRYPILFNYNSTDSRLSNVILSWAVERSLMTGHVEEIYLDAIQTLLDSKDEIISDPKPYLITHFCHIIVHYLEGNSNRSEIALEILNHPLTMEYNILLHNLINDQTERYSPMMLLSYPYFPSIPIILKSLRFDNEYLVKHYHKMTYKYPTETEILDRISPCPIEKDLSILNHSYSRSLNASKWMPTAEHIKLISTRPLCKMTDEFWITLGRYYYSDASILWRRLGLGEEYKKMFDDDNMFWESKDTFMEVYNSLISGSYYNY